jgi:hypothetical protein
MDHFNNFDIESQSKRIKNRIISWHRKIDESNQIIHRLKRKRPINELGAQNWSLDSTEPPNRIYPHAGGYSLEGSTLLGEFVNYVGGKYYFTDQHGSL